MQNDGNKDEIREWLFCEHSGKRRQLAKQTVNACALGIAVLCDHMSEALHVIDSPTDLTQLCIEILNDAQKILETTMAEMNNSEN